MSVVLTKNEIERGFIRLGVAKGMMLEVHCSLGAFGHVESGALTVINALKDAVGTDGAIVMPTYMHSPAMPLTKTDRALGLTLKIRLLCDENEKTGMGIVSDTFKKMPDVITGEGMFRVSAWGKDAQKHVSRGFWHLIDSDGHALLMGVDIYSMSSMHYVEDCLPIEIKTKFRPSEEARNIYPESEWHIESWTPAPARPWHVIQQQAYEKGFIRESVIGNATCMLVQVKHTIELYRHALLHYPFELYGLPRHMNRPKANG